MRTRSEAPRKGYRNPELAASAVQSALGEAGLAVHELSYLIGHTATPARLMPSNIGQVAELLDYAGRFVEFRQACTGSAAIGGWVCAVALDCLPLLFFLLLLLTARQHLMNRYRQPERPSPHPDYDFHARQVAAQQAR